MKPKTLAELGTAATTAELHARGENWKTLRGRTYGSHAEGQRLIEELLPPLAEFMRSSRAPAPPRGLKRVVRRLTPEELAAVALSPLLHQIAVAGESDDESQAMKLKREMGRILHGKLLMAQLLKDDRHAYRRAMTAAPEVRRRVLAAATQYQQRRWSNELYVRAGNWLLDCVLTTFDGFFVLDVDGLPCVTKEGEDLALQLAAECVYHNPAFLPAIGEFLKDWTGWRDGGYWGEGTRVSAAFVRDPHPATEKAIRRAFRDGSMREQVDGVNTLQRVPWAINAAMLSVVKRFAAGIIGKKLNETPWSRALLMASDIATASRIGAQSFYVPMNCDFRGRVFGIPHFNFQREDHIRALFQFAQGMPIGDDGLYWLMIHVANSGDFDRISKRPFRERIAWAEKNKDRITRTARDPAATIDWWRQADAPFVFVAGCIELAAAWDAGPSYVTHLPVSFDGTCSGVQHLAMMMRDEDVGRLVNLTPGDEPQDIYQLITDVVVAALQSEASADDERARWWLGKKFIDRKLIKSPAMTFAYSVTTHGMMEQLVEAYRERCGNNEPTKANARYLAKHIETACKKVMPRPAEAMKFIRSLAAHCADKGKPLKWTSPTGFPVENRYCKPIVKVVHLELRGEYVRHRVADGFEPGIVRNKSLNAAAPNFVHSMDASHLIRIVNKAASAGITSLATVHDSFGCLAPQARELRKIIGTTFAELYSRDFLADLRDAAGSSLALPAKGSLDPRAVLGSLYVFA